MRDGAQVLHQLVPGHADARVGDGQRARGLVGRDGDRRGGLSARDLAAGAEEADLLARVGRVGDEFPDKHLAVGGERVDDDAEKLLDLGLEGMLFRLAHVSTVRIAVSDSLPPRRPMGPDRSGTAFLVAQPPPLSRPPRVRPLIVADRGLNPRRNPPMGQKSAHAQTHDQLDLDPRIRTDVLSWSRRARLVRRLVPGDRHTDDPARGEALEPAAPTRTQAPC